MRRDPDTPLATEGEHRVPEATVRPELDAHLDQVQQTAQDPERVPLVNLDRERSQLSNTRVH